jgi:predicted transcriptional regulator
MKRKNGEVAAGLDELAGRPRTLLRALDEVADQRDMSRSAVMRAALAAYCQAHGVQMERPAVEAGIE